MFIYFHCSVERTRFHRLPSGTKRDFPSQARNPDGANKGVVHACRSHAIDTKLTGSLVHISTWAFGIELSEHGKPVIETLYALVEGLEEDGPKTWENQSARGFIGHKLCIAPVIYQLIGFTKSTLEISVCSVFSIANTYPVSASKCRIFPWIHFEQLSLVVETFFVVVLQGAPKGRPNPGRKLVGQLQKFESFVCLFGPALCGIRQEFIIAVGSCKT